MLKEKSQSYSLVFFIKIYIRILDGASLPPLRDTYSGNKNGDASFGISSDVEKMKSSERYRTISFILNDVQQQKESWVNFLLFSQCIFFS